MYLNQFLIEKKKRHVEIFFSNKLVLLDDFSGILNFEYIEMLLKTKFIAEVH